MKKQKSIIEMSQERLMDSILDGKILKVLKTTAIVVGGVYAFGFGCKILNFSTKHFLALKNTIK